MSYLYKKPKLLLVFIFIGYCSVPAGAQQTLLSYQQSYDPPAMQDLLKWKETFTYEVNYSFFTLGTVQTTIVRDTTYEGEQLWWLQTKIISDPSIPFMDKEINHYNTFFVATDSLPYTRLYWRDNVDEDEFNAERYDFDYEAGKVYISNDGEPKDTLELNEPSTSGQLIFYYGRLFAGSDQDYRLPVYLEGEKGYIDVQNNRNSEIREYPAFNNPVKTYSSRGNAHIDGPFGFSGKFKAWFVADNLRIPAEAHAKVWLGNVKVRLVDYNKKLR
ncbi:MAG TPA: hypothetical protein VK112_08255 [Fodinibius sp.]|nr:hypothetical protein [Fodinibius sp.]